MFMTPLCKISYLPHQKGFRVWERVQHSIHWFYLPTANLTSKSAQFLRESKPASCLVTWSSGAVRCVEHNSYISTLTTTVKLFGTYQQIGTLRPAPIPCYANTQLTIKCVSFTQIADSRVTVLLFGKYILQKLYYSQNWCFSLSK